MAVNILMALKAILVFQQGYRDRDAHRWAPFPHHRTYGSRIRRFGWSQQIQIKLWVRWALENETLPAFQHLLHSTGKNALFNSHNNLPRPFSWGPFGPSLGWDLRIPFCIVPRYDTSPAWIEKKDWIWITKKLTLCLCRLDIVAYFFLQLWKYIGSRRHLQIGILRYFEVQLGFSGMSTNLM
jgi:hypothetical protein